MPIYTSILSDSETRRFQKQISIPGIGLEGQNKIRRARIAVIGAGGTGASVLQQLSALGIGYFGIIDFSLVDETNVQKQSLYGGADLGKLKTIISKQRLQEIFPLTQYEIINLRLEEHNVETALKSFDIIVDATNDPDSSLLICDACVLMGKPLVYSFVSGSKIIFSVFNYKMGPSIRDSAINYDFVSVGNGAIHIAYGFAGTFLASEVIKIIVGMPNVLYGETITFDCFTYSFVSEIIK